MLPNNLVEVRKNHKFNLSSLNKWVDNHLENYENISFTKNNTCDGYRTFAPEYRSINSGTCESNGFQDLLSEHECCLLYTSPSPRD